MEEAEDRNEKQRLMRKQYYYYISTTTCSWSFLEEHYQSCMYHGKLLLCLDLLAIRYTVFQFSSFQFSFIGMLGTTGKVGNRNEDGSDTVLSRAVSNHWTGLLGLTSLTASAHVQHSSFTLTANSHIMDIVVSIEYYNQRWILMRTDRHQKLSTVILAGAYPHTLSTGPLGYTHHITSQNRSTSFILIILCLACIFSNKHKMGLYLTDQSLEF